ncbi:hypothetical protein J1N35_044530 [Gossypium stocksii]|uniref:Uncharacterized protein n=1 Tax=Gossypium stocksii TaxID=47602 RepID=A0A9D3U9P6_9ROSI|nr:hypothetical protein J1N35_044530 [Gossypium stocksii]
MLASMSSVLKKKHENLCTIKENIKNLEDLLGGQVTLARQYSITKLMNSQQKLDTLFKEHMIKLMKFFAKAKDNGVELDVNTQIEIMSKSLTKEFIGPRAAYNLGNKALI